MHGRGMRHDFWSIILLPSIVSIVVFSLFLVKYNNNYYGSEGVHVVNVSSSNPQLTMLIIQVKKKGC
jgi:uncharacterized membrane protein YhaH (DUF805 family)